MASQYKLADLYPNSGYDTHDETIPETTEQDALANADESTSAKVKTIPILGWLIGILLVFGILNLK